ncbi:hypothetical protein Thiosp_03889 [Thiorhodovibrio litoralis]|nr:hypothetical protein Thiosp_03889 [Thiorhodovibrio litoralis]
MIPAFPEYENGCFMVDTTTMIEPLTRPKLTDCLNPPIHHGRYPLSTSLGNAQGKDTH